LKKKASLYTSAVLNGSWFLTSIDTAMWLHKLDGYKEITICCISSYNSPFNFLALLMRLRNLSSYLTKNKFQKLQNFLNPPKEKNNNYSEVALFCSGKVDQASMSIGELEIKFVRERLNKKISLINYIKLIYKIIIDYKYYFNRSALKSRSYLDYRISGIYSGLFILSEALRSDYKSSGSVFKSSHGILTALYKLHRSFLEFKDISFSKESENFVCGPDQEYLYGFFTRFLSDRSMCFIETNNLLSPYIKRELSEKYYSRLSLSQSLNVSLVPNKEKISDYYKNRIERPWETFNYKLTKYSSVRNLENLNGVTVILYLHSFTDAQYVYGYDGYHDLMDWCYSTIRLLNSNKYVSSVIVKPHPESTSDYHPGDAIANNYLKSRISSFDKVQWANFHFGVQHIKSSGMVVGITHHGSVAEELVFYKIPVIGSSHSFWGKDYKFGYWWDSLKEYEELISSKSITELVVNNTQYDELYRYAMDLHFSKNSNNTFLNSSTWQDIFKAYLLMDCQEHGENMEQIKRIVSTLDPEDNHFKKYIESRLKRINSLNEFDQKLQIKLK
jgi:hypothetical protein